MAEPTEADVAEFNTQVDAYISRQAALGITLSREDAVIQFGNLLSNVAANPELVEKLSTIPERVDTLEARVAYLEDVQGGTVVGPG